MPNNPNISKAACPISAPSILTCHKQGEFPRPPLLTNCTLKDDAFFSLPSSVLDQMKMRSGNQPKSTAVFNTQLSLTLDRCALAVWQYMLNATQRSTNQQPVSSLYHRTRTPAHRFLKRTTKYLLNHKMTQSSTYTTPDLPPTLAARLAVCKGIHSNKYSPLKSS